MRVRKRQSRNIEIKGVRTRQERERMAEEEEEEDAALEEGTGRDRGRLKRGY
jgi:hypothetical protein